MRISRPSFAALSLVLGSAFFCNAQITYDLNQTIGAGGVTGDIITDGTIGVLDSADILDWNLLLNNGTTTYDLGGPGPDQFGGVNGADLSATATQLLFNFSGTDGGFFNFANIVPGSELLCFSSAPDCFSVGGTQAPVGESLLIAPESFTIQSTSLSGTQVIASTPEPSTLILLVAGIALLGYRGRTASGLSSGPGVCPAPHSSPASPSER